MASDMSIDAIPGMELKQEMGTLVLPGQIVGSLVDTSGNPGQKRPVVRLGMGVTQRESSLQSVKAGTLSVDSRRNKIWIENNQKRYVPALGDMVIGVVIERHSEEYRIDINATDTATLPALAFEGATKKNKPNLRIGSVVYCRITRASKNMEAEASCIEPGSSKSWVGGETLYGELKDGNLVQLSLALARSLLTKNNPTLTMLGDRVPFECAAGVNGRVWVHAASLKNTMLLSLALQKADLLEAERWTEFVKEVFEQD